MAELTIQQAAAELRLSEIAVRALCRRGTLPAVHRGHTWVVQSDDLEACRVARARVALTPMQDRALRMLIDGYSTREIAEEWASTQRCVCQMIGRARDRLGALTTYQAIAFYLQRVPDTGMLEVIHDE